MADETVSIASEDLQAEIHPLGAQLFALRDAEGRDLLWNGDPQFWSGRAPILFPIVGALANGEYHFEDRTYRLPRHGFARNRLFTVAEATPLSALFRLRWDEETRQSYPFAFELLIRFTLLGATLMITATIWNLEDHRTMPASFGFHPALCWPLPYGNARAGHAIHFEKEEATPIRRLNAEGLIRPDSFPTPVTGRDLDLRDDLFVDDAVIFDALQSRRLRYGAKGGPEIEIAFADTPYLGLWSKPGADFICIEPWHGIADSQNFHGDLRAKPGIFLVEPGKSKRCGMAISLQR